MLNSFVVNNIIAFFNNREQIQRIFDTFHVPKFTGIPSSRARIVVA